MRTSIRSQLFLSVLLFLPTPALAEGFKSYSEEVFLAKLILDCSSEKIIPASDDFGAFYICTLGEASTVRWFVSEQPQNGRVQNVGLVWVEWLVDTEDGMRADFETAETALEYLIGLYVPTKRNDIRMVFWNSKNEVLSTLDFIVYYTFKPGPHKNERIIALQEK